MEHTDNPDIAREIATDHLTEDPEYYKKHKIMESKKKRFTTKFATKTDLIDIYKSTKKEINPTLKLIKKDYEEDLKILEDQLYDKAFDNLTVEESDKVKQILGECQYILPSLRLAALFHDLGKANTKTLKEGRAQFIGHEKLLSFSGCY